MREMHRLLQRQLKKSGLNGEIHENLKTFLTLVNDAYHSFDQDVGHLERILEESSQELFEANMQLRKDVQTIESKLTKVATNIKDVIFEMDTSGRWTYLNSTWETLSGYSVEESLGKKYHEFLPKEVTDSFKKKVIGRNQKFKVQSAVFQYKRPDDTTIWLDFSIKPISSQNQTIEGFIGTIADITALKKTEEKLIRTREKAVKANEAKDQFLSVMSHEIRTPLNAVIGVSNLLLMENPREGQLENLNVLKYSSNHLLALVNDILDFNKIVSGTVQLEEDDFSLEHVLNSQYQMFQHKAASKGLVLKVDFDRNLPKMLVGDTLRLGQVLTNLIGNAIKFTKKGRVGISAKLKSVDGDINLVEFKVSDSGIGIPKNKIKKIFQPFVQADSNTTRLYGGTGLGLAICKNLVQIMQGDLLCESSYGHGSTFRFTLPFKTGAIKLVSDSFLDKKASFNTKIPNLEGVSVLVVEDNKVNVTIIKKFLNKWGIDCDVAENGLIGFEVSAQKKYDLIFMDIEMPVMNGYQASSGIKESRANPNKETPIIALTASTGIENDDELRKNGIDGLVLKPFDPKELFETIENFVGKPQMHD